MHESGVHVLELDLLRRGTRTFEHPRLPSAPYLVMLNRAYSSVMDVWPVTLQEPLPRARALAQP